MNTALIVIDYINDICHPEGKLSGKWYSDFIETHNTLEKVNEKIAKFREAENEVIFVKVAFKPWYTDCPLGSPLFWKAPEFWVLERDTWGTNFLESLDIHDTDTVIIKNRVSAFCSDLHEYLSSKNITNIELCWCSTDLAVEGTAREGHDRDYTVSIFADGCAAANEDDHQKSIEAMKKIATINL